MKRTFLCLFLAALIFISVTPKVFAEGNIDKQGNMPKIYGEAAITIDVDTGEIIYANNIDKREYPASTTKFLTALLLAENKTKTDKLKYTKSAKEQPGFSLNVNLYPISIGDTLTAEGAMDSLLIYSANDIAYMIADNIGGDSKKFADLMNERIVKLGLKNTHFLTPNGLHDDNHYTTAYDLSVIAREAFKNQWIKETIAKPTSKVSTSSGTTFPMENRNKLLGQDGCLGGKTGFTEKAGRCLVAFYERNGRRIMGVVMKSDKTNEGTNVFDDMKKIIDWSYLAKPAILYKKGDIVETVKVNYKPLRFFGPEKTAEVPLMVEDEVIYYNNNINNVEKKESISKDNLSIWNLNSSKAIGSIIVREREASKQYKLYTNVSTMEILKQNMILYICTAAVAFILLLIILILIFRVRRSRRRRRYYSA